MDILQVIEELEDIHRNSRHTVPRIGRWTVDGERLKAVITELYTSIPSDIQEAKVVLKQREDILERAQNEAEQIKDEARRILETANRQSEQLLKAAQEVLFFAQKRTDTLT